MITTRRILVTVAAVVGGFALILLARQAADATPTSDTAVIEIYTLLASTGDLLLGPYSRFQWHHPGPLYFFWMVPFYVLAGFRTAGLNAGALAMNLASLALMTAVVNRRAGKELSVAIVGASAVFAWRAAELLVSPWNPHIPVFPLMALILTAADTVSGTPAMLPLVAALASLVGQTHVGLLPSALAIGGVALVGAVAQVGAKGWTTSGFRRTVIATAVVLIVLWMPTIIEQLTGRPGNITQLWTFFVSESHPGQTFSTAVSAWSDMLTGLARPDFYVAHGWPFRESPVKWSEALAVVQLIALMTTAALAFRAGRRFDLALTALLALTSLLALWSATRIDGAIFDHEVFWIVGVGVLNTALVLAPIARVGFETVGRSFHPSTSLGMTLSPSKGQGRLDAGLKGPRYKFRVATTASWVLAFTAVIAGVSHLQEAVVHSSSPGTESEAANAVAEDLRVYFLNQHVVRPLVRIDQDAWGMAAGVILKLQKAGVPVAVEDDWIAMFTPAFAADGHEPVILTLAGKAQHVRMLGSPGDALIVSHDPLFVHRAAAGATR